MNPVTLDQLVAGDTSIGPWYGASCRADREITFDAYAVPAVGLLFGMEQDTLEPRWLADPLNTGVVLAASADPAANAASRFVARVPPDATPGAVDARCDGSAIYPAACPFAPYAGGYVTVAGHFDDGESLSCRIADPGNETPSLTPEDVILGCREQFVIDT